MISISLAEGDISSGNPVPGEVKRSGADGISRDTKLFELEWAKYGMSHSRAGTALSLWGSLPSFIYIFARPQVRRGARVDRRGFAGRSRSDISYDIIDQVQGETTADGLVKLNAGNGDVFVCVPHASW